ncbi:hypothetical protein Hanom_Chr05g00423491 [Helianthus anomalus]
MSAKTIDSGSNNSSKSQMRICTSVNCFDFKVANDSVGNARWTCSSDGSLSVFFTPAKVSSTPCIGLYTIITIK